MRRLLVAVCLGLVPTLVAAAPPTFVGVKAPPVSDLFTTTITFTMNVGTGADRFLAVWCLSDRYTFDEPSGATYAGVDMTPLGTFVNDLVNRVFILANPTSGSNSVIVSFPGNAGWQCSAIAYSGVDQTTPLPDAPVHVGYVGGTLNTPEFTVPSMTSDDLAVALFAGPSNTITMTPAAPAVERQDATVGTSPALRTYALEEAGTGAVVVNGTLSAGGTEWQGTAFRLKGVGVTGGATAASQFMRMGVGP